MTRFAPRIVYVDHCAKLSGAEIALERVLGPLAELGIRAHVVLGEDGPFAERLRARGCSTEVLPLDPSVRETRREDVGLAPAGVLRTVSASAYAGRLARRLHRLRPDLVHTNSLKAALYAGVAGRLAGIPVVWHLRDRIAPDSQSTGGVRLVRTAARLLPSGIVANSRATLRTIEGSVGGKPSAVVHDAVTRSPRVPEEPAGPFRAVMVGRVAPWKGQHVFLEAFAKAFPAGEERATLVGASLFGEETYDRRLRQLASDLGVADRVEFAGFRADPGPVVAAAHVVVHASVTPEPFGLVVAEAMASGRPVVAAGAGGPVEMVEDGVTGLLFPPGDVAALASALQRLAGDSELRRTLGGAAHAWSVSLAPERIAGEIAGFYRELLR